MSPQSYLVFIPLILQISGSKDSSSIWRIGKLTQVTFDYSIGICHKVIPPRFACQTRYTFQVSSKSLRMELSRDAGDITDILAYSYMSFLRLSQIFPLSEEYWLNHRKGWNYIYILLKPELF